MAGRCGLLRYELMATFIPPFKLCCNNLTRGTIAVNNATASSHLTYSIKSEMSLTVGTHLIPHPDKIERGGEDAFFISSSGPSSGGAIAVADGVSGWAELGVDPSLFSRELMANASSMVDGLEVDSDPQVLLRNAHAATTSKGSATVVVTLMERNGILKIANVGDCGLRVIRKGQLTFSTCPQEHYFDCPYQLSSEASTQTYLDAVVSSLKLLEGDKIVVGSDGLFDNVYDPEIVSTVASNSDVAEAAKAIARLLAIIQWTPALILLIHQKPGPRVLMSQIGRSSWG